MMKNEFMGVIFTNHALQRLKERRITQSDAWYTFRHSDRQAKGKTQNSWKFSKTYGPQTIEVIAKKNEERQWVVLSCWSKMVGDNRPLFPQKENFLWQLTKETGQKLWKKIKKDR